MILHSFSLDHLIPEPIERGIRGGGGDENKTCFIPSFFLSFVLDLVPERRMEGLRDDALLRDVLSSSLEELVVAQINGDKDNQTQKTLKNRKARDKTRRRKRREASYVAETLPNLHHCILWITIPDLCAPFVEIIAQGNAIEGPKLQASWFQRQGKTQNVRSAQQDEAERDKENDLNGEREDQGDIEPLVISLPRCAELPDPFVFSVVGPSDYVEIQLKVPPLSSAKTLFAEAFRSTSSADKLSSSNSLHPPKDVMRSIQCRECGTTFTNNLTQSVQFSVKLMPSSSWIELSDLWVCYGPQHFQQFPRKRISAQENVCPSTTIFISSPSLFLSPLLR